MEVWELIARERIRDTMAAYTHNGDRGRVEALAGTFTEDGVLEIKDGETAAGRPAIAALLTGAVSRGSSERTESGPGIVRHFVTNLRFDELTPVLARTSAYFLVMTARGPDHWGRYRDELVPAGDRWLIARRVVRVDAFDARSVFARAGVDQAGQAGVDQAGVVAHARDGMDGGLAGGSGTGSLPPMSSRNGG